MSDTATLLLHRREEYKCFPSFPVPLFPRRNFPSSRMKGPWAEMRVFFTRTTILNCIPVIPPAVLITISEPNNVLMDENAQRPLHPVNICGNQSA